MEQSTSKECSRGVLAARVIFLCVGAAIAYGIVNDQITIRISQEYFTIAHPPIFGEQPPTTLAILWGVAGTWWIGLFFGIVLALSATMGPKPVRESKSLYTPVLCLITIMAGSALAAGIVGYFLCQFGFLNLQHFIGRRALLIPDFKHPSFFCVACAHYAGYFVGAIGAIVMARNVWMSHCFAATSQAPT